MPSAKGKKKTTMTKAETVNHRTSGRNKSKVAVKAIEKKPTLKTKKKISKTKVAESVKNDLLDADVILKNSYIENKTLTYGLKRLGNGFFDVPSEKLAKSLLGKILVRRLNDGTHLKGRIVETECYPGGEDRASCTYNGRITEKMKALYMKPGTTYVYLTYGMYHCFNISSQGPGAAVLLRAIEPLDGLEYMQQERAKGKKSSSTSKCKELKTHELCSGPAKLCIAFNITKPVSEQDLTTWDGMWIEDDESEASSSFSNIVTSTRIGIDSVGIQWSSRLYRFYLFGNSCVSHRDKVREKEFEKSVK